jgi:hypothetical protein
MPIYEYYCPDNHTIYQFFAKTLAQGKIVPKCPEDPSFRMQRIMSAFAVQTGGKKGEGDETSTPAAESDDPKMEAAMNAMESEFANIDENDPRAMGRMMRRMAELTGEKIDGEMEEVVRKLEEGADPDSLEEELGDSFADEPGAPGGELPAGDKPEGGERKTRFKARRMQPRRDPLLYDYA